MTKQFKPMLAAEADLNKLKFPLIASPKLDGVRALIKGGVVLSRSLKPIPNKHVQMLFGRPELEGLDGELIVGSPTDKDCFNNTSGAIRRESGDPDVRFFVFDKWDRTGPYDESVGDINKAATGFRVVHLQRKVIFSIEELKAYEEECLEAGFEGIILRDPQSPYKFGRSTAKEGYLLKVKRFADSEARVLDVEELMHNNNPATCNECGHTERSSHKANLVPAGTMGRLRVEDIHTGQRFYIGTGFTAEQRVWWWDNYQYRASNLGLIVKYKFFPVGVKELPRHPVYLGLREGFDMSN